MSSLAPVVTDRRHETIHTLHPDPSRHGVRISAEKYGQMQAAIEQAFAGQATLTLKDLILSVLTLLGDSFEGSRTWYLITVKLDLEARGILRRVPGGRIQRLEWVRTQRSAAA